MFRRWLCLIVLWSLTLPVARNFPRNLHREPAPRHTMPLPFIPRGKGELAADNIRDVVALHFDNLAELSSRCHIAVPEAYRASVDRHRRLAASGPKWTT